MKKYIILGIIAFGCQSHAYLSLLTTGDVLQPNQFQILGYIESVFNKYDGVNVNARGSMGLSDEIQADIELGLGEFDVMLGGFVKWVPIPDHDKQPAIGVRAGLSYVDMDDFTQTSVVAMPFLSKSFLTEYGKFTPYGGLPLGVNSNDDDTYFTTRLALGNEWTHDDYKNMHVIGEIAFGLSKSFSSLNIGGSYDF